MKKLLFLSLAVLIALMASANPVDPDRAVQVAKNYLAQYVKGADQYSATVVYTHSMPKSGQPAMYVVNVGNMFVLVAADDVAHPVLGYSLSRPWPVQNEELKIKNEESADAGIKLPSQVTGYLDDLARQIAAAAQAGIAPDKETAAEWQLLLTTNHIPLTTNPPDSVGPLLTTTWDQGQYYNAMCPEDANGPDGHAVTGCVATAMAQIINYWGYPVHGRGTHSYENNYGTLTVNYDSVNYDYANMPTALTSTSSSEEINAVATLMRDCGVAADMGYESWESSTYDIDARAGLINFFRFSPNISYAEKADLSNAEWDSLIQTNLANNQPVMYSGHGDAGGHTFVCDGYKTDDYYHFNFGWGGYGDGWYLTDALNPGYDFSSNQHALFGIVPDSTGNVILGQMEGTSTFTVDEPLEFYHLLGHNAYTGEGGGISFNSTTLFVPANENNQIVADILNFNGEQISVGFYDGTSPYCLRILNGGSSNDLSPIVSSRNTISVRYSDEGEYTGFRFCISQANGCRMVSNISSTVDTTSVHLSWSENGSSTQWEIKYGITGFDLGSGTTITVNDTMADITGLTKWITYDFYIRPVCGSVWYGPISIKTDLSYWQDYVTSEPSGCTWNEDGYVIVSTPEQLTWFLCNHSQSNILIAANLDMSGHRWKPIIGYSGNLDGGNHFISNITIREDHHIQNDAGFFESIGNNNLIKNIFFFSPIISLGNKNYTSGFLAGRVYSDSVLIENCGVIDGAINCSSKNAGGLIGEVMGRNIIRNCFANTTLINHLENHMTGGFIGHTEYNASIHNCYSASDINFDHWYHNGQIIAYNDGCSITKCYGKASELPLIYTNTATAGQIRDTSTFNDNGLLYSGITFDGGTYTDLMEVLNREVCSQNDSSWCVWEEDLSNINNGFPVLGGSYVVICPNIKNIRASNIIFNNQPTLHLEWDNPEAVSSFVIRCFNTNDTNSPLYITSNDAQLNLDVLELGEEYHVNVRAVCDNNALGGWGEGISHIFDLPYWTDIVTRQPDGYSVDDNGNVEITTAEGLAWLSSCVNALNHQEYNNFQGKAIRLLADIDMGGYRWLPIGNWNQSFSGFFSGNGHIIENLHVNEKNDNVGLFGHLHEAKVSNLIIRNGQIKGGMKVGGICGSYSTIWERINETYGENIIESCHVIATNITGTYYVGGICGDIEPDVDGLAVCNCLTSGVVSGTQFIGGLFGDVRQDGISLSNCFSIANININLKNKTGGAVGYMGGLVGSTYNLVTDNCYFAGNIGNWDYEGYAPSFVGTLFGNMQTSITRNCYGLYDSVLPPAIQSEGCFWEESNVAFTKDAELCTFMNNVTIQDVIYTDLLSALNAWVDANDTAGIYRHWAADTANVNGGFPVFAITLPCSPTTGSDNITVCDSYSWKGETYTSSAELLDTLTTADGCDSIVTHHLTIHHPIHTSVTREACETYTWTDGNGETYTASANPTYPHPDAHNCTQVDTLHLTIHYPTHTAVTREACETYTWTDGNGETYTASANPTYPHPDANNCTQVDTLHLTIHYPTHTSVTREACETYTWTDGNGETYTASANPTYPHPDANNCTQVDTLHLTIHYPTHTSVTREACETYTWTDGNGETYTASANPTYPHPDVHNCTQVDTLHLTINSAVNVAVTEVACDSFFWNGTTYTATGTYTYSHADIHSCTQVDTLHLTINMTVYTDIEKEAYGSCAWHGIMYSESGDYTYTTNAANGCDSIVTLHLSITPIHTVTLISSNEAWGTVSSSGSVVDNGYFAATATPLRGYAFIAWLEGTDTLSTHSTFVFQVNHDMTLTALFAPNNGIGDVDMTDVSVYSSDSRIFVRGAEGYDVYVYDVNGRMMDRRLNAPDLIEFHLSSSGVYLVKVGNAPARRVVLIL